MNTPSVLLCAPTRKAAFNISAQTLHNTFSLPVTQRGIEGLMQLSTDGSHSMSIALADLNLPPIGDSLLYKEIMRQRDDVPFVTVLNNMAIEAMTESDIEIFQSQVVQISPEKGAISKAFDQIIGQCRDGSYIQRLLFSADNHAKQFDIQGLIKTLLLKISEKYMMTVNIDTTDGLVNETKGILETFVNSDL
ncbi:hypothetical protein PHYBLDRAFT_139117 [Phycomyces blakesleeanus NRRL 1555(-)]|uniref:Uncharacterized protein n=1 Tax=Phycomyces blakesleeanus (strain ATCC 8743b / DSM 1359 / FGSC 10004 / NBRC 33097 / NRRL 1555) TaxID=763407 RepID=A0A167RGD3_PHYB8|nr:hypothetical protein PHYBLDRAFT_139117 [Phycomyces blakesleeanus NRRL 1555(-)]OAD81569.1 hypothetical protein PHYBLDRAFT_139117 [Phycomyces blakesleeanus NRRL 1555(-)]|eukprot:XP_018299609.1 hypothetical protein PHYBLDRAFT_139117 [Phycomyces blakesleeanus NRRL 1555(-)]